MRVLFHACNSSTWEAKQEGCGFKSSLGYEVSSQNQNKTKPKNFRLLNQKKTKNKKQKNKPTNKSTQKSVHVIFCVLKLKGKNSGVYHSLVFSWSFQSNVLWCYDNLKYRLRDLTVSPLMIVSLPLLMKTNILDIYINGMWWEGVAKDQRTQVCASLPPTILAHTPLPWDITDDLNRMSAAQKGRPGLFAWPLFPLPG